MASSCSQHRRVGASSPGGSEPAFSTSSCESRSQSESPEDDPLCQESLTFTAEWDQRAEVMSLAPLSIPIFPSTW